MNSLDHWALTGAIFVPVIGAALLGLVPRRAELTLKAWALLASLASLGLVVYLIVRFDFSHSARFQFVANKQWIEVIHSRYHIGLDGISLPLLALSALITVLCVIYSWDHFPEPFNPKAFLILILVLASGMNGTFSSLDLILLSRRSSTSARAMPMMRPTPPARIRRAVLERGPEKELLAALSLTGWASPGCTT